MPRRIDPSEISEESRRIFARLSPGVGFDINDLWIATPEEHRAAVEEVYHDLGIIDSPIASRGMLRHEDVAHPNRKTLIQQVADHFLRVLRPLKKQQRRHLR